ncbi:MAG: hypothetical protein EXR63_05380 [Dehalococcoidia bacterium]|nr:hypothetical protein [Dehalococcoidia bacterium]MSQ36552.1 hypothetical protein [Dehalococcoidia bacterium]
MDRDTRRFVSTLLLVAGPAGGALGWLAFNAVGAAVIFGGSGATVAGVLLWPSWRRGATAIGGLALGWWPVVANALLR